MTDLDPDAVRRDAVLRLIAAADGHPCCRGTYDPDLVMVRRDAIDRLWKWALKAAHDAGRLDDNTRADLMLLRQVAAGTRDLLNEAVVAGGVGALLGDDEPPALTVGQLEDALAGWA